MNIMRVFLAWILALAGLSGPADVPAFTQVKLVEDLMIGGPDTDVLFLWTSVSVDREDNIFFSDALDCSIKKFGPDGRFLKKTGRKGRGPGEFDTAVGVAVHGESVYAWDVNSRSVQVFDRELVFQKTLPMPGYVSALNVLSDGRLAAAVRASSGLPAISLFSPEGVNIRTMPLSAGKDPDRIDSVGFAVDASGAFYLGYLYSDRIEKRTPSGDLVWSKSPFGGQASELFEVQGLKFSAETCVLSLALDGRGRIYVLGGKNSAHPAREVRVYRPDGTPDGMFLLPEPSHSLFFDGRDRLYVAADGGVTMKRYRLVFE